MMVKNIKQKKNIGNAIIFQKCMETIKKKKPRFNNLNKEIMMYNV